MKIKETLTSREQAIAWGNKLSIMKQIPLAQKYVNRSNPDSLTSREIEIIGRKETQSNKDAVEIIDSMKDNYPSNAKQFKEFDPRLFKQYKDKFNEEHKFTMFLVLLKDFKLESSIESNIMTLVALRNI